MPGKESRSVSAVYLLFDGVSGVPLAIMEGEELTARRTAGASALAARYLARGEDVLHVGGLEAERRDVGIDERSALWQGHVDEHQALVGGDEQRRQPHRPDAVGVAKHREGRARQVPLRAGAARHGRVGLQCRGRRGRGRTRRRRGLRANATHLEHEKSTDQHQLTHDHSREIGVPQRHHSADGLVAGRDRCDLEHCRIERRRSTRSACHTFHSQAQYPLPAFSRRRSRTCRSSRCSAHRFPTTSR